LSTKNKQHTKTEQDLNASNSGIAKVPKSVGPKAISGTSGHQSNTAMVTFDWQSMTSY